MPERRLHPRKLSRPTPTPGRRSGSVPESGSHGEYSHGECSHSEYSHSEYSHSDYSVPESRGSDSRSSVEKWHADAQALCAAIGGAPACGSHTPPSRGGNVPERRSLRTALSCCSVAIAPSCVGSVPMSEGAAIVSDWSAGSRPSSVGRVPALRIVSDLT